MQETWVRSLDQEDTLEKEMATHSTVLAWEIPWTKEPGRLQSMGLQVRHDLVIKPPPSSCLNTHTYSQEAKKQGCEKLSLWVRLPVFETQLYSLLSVLLEQFIDPLWVLFSSFVKWACESGKIGLAHVCCGNQLMWKSQWLNSTNDYFLFMLNTKHRLVGVSAVCGYKCSGWWRHLKTVMLKNVASEMTTEWAGKGTGLVHTPFCHHQSDRCKQQWALFSTLLIIKYSYVFISN